MVQVVRLALCTHKDDPSLVKNCLRALTSLVGYSAQQASNNQDANPGSGLPAPGVEENKVLLQELQAPQTVLEAMRTLHGEAKIIQLGLLAVSALAVGHAPLRRMLGEAGACEVVMAALRDFPDHQEIQTYACQCVVHLAKNDPKNVRLLRTGEVGRLMSVAGTRFEGVEGIQDAREKMAGILESSPSSQGKRKLEGEGDEEGVPTKKKASKAKNGIEGSRGTLLARMLTRRTVESEPKLIGVGLYQKKRSARFS